MSFVSRTSGARLPARVTGASASNYGQITVGLGAAAGSTTAWIELSSGEPYDIAGLTLQPQSNQTTDCYIELAIGAIGEEVVVFGPIHVHLVIYRNSGTIIPVPLAIPRGTRIAYRVTRLVSGTGATFGMWATPIVAQPYVPQGFFGCDLLTWNATDGRYDTVIMQSYGDTPTLYEVVASTPRAYRAIGYAVMRGTGPGTEYASGRLRTYLGALGEEVEAGGDFRVNADITSGARFLPIVTDPMPMRLPAGSRVSVGLTSSAHTYYVRVALLGYY